MEKGMEFMSVIGFSIVLTLLFGLVLYFFNALKYVPVVLFVSLWVSYFIIQNIKDNISINTA